MVIAFQSLAQNERICQFVGATSKTGIYAVAEYNDSTYLVNLKEKIIISSTFLPVNSHGMGWIADSLILFYVKSNKEYTYFTYNPITNMKDEFAKNDVKENILNNHDITFPNHVNNLNELFGVYFDDTNILRMFYPLRNETKPILNINQVNNVPKELSINSYTVNSDGSKVLFSGTSNDMGYIFQLNTIEKTVDLVEKSTGIINDSYVYFMNNNKDILYYKYLSELNSEDTTKVSLIMYNIDAKSSHVIAILENKFPSYAADIPRENSLFLHYIDGSYPISVTNSNNVVYDIINGLLYRLNVDKIKY